MGKVPLTAEQSDAAASAVAKAGVVWAGAGIGFTDIPWSHLAAAAAFFYSVHLIIGWWIDRFWRPRLEARRKDKGDGGLR